MSKRDHLQQISKGLPVYIIIAVITIFISLAIIYRVKSTEFVESEIDSDIDSREPLFDETMIYDYQWEDGDYQGDYPEESAAVYILLRANGYEVSKEDLSTIPTDDNALGISENLNRIVNGVSDSSKVALPVSGLNLVFLPAPSMIWIDQDGDVYPVVYLFSDDSKVTVSNPREGIREYPFSVFHKMYDSAERQCIYIADRGFLTY